MGLSRQTTEGLVNLADQAERMLRDRILPFWLSLEDPSGGFRIAVDARGGVDERAPKTLVFAARLAWTFATAARLYGVAAYTRAAQHAFEHLECFFDKSHGGLWFALDRQNHPVDRSKHVYGQAFALFAFSAAAQLGDERRERMAAALFELLEARAKHGARGLYVESFNEAWSETPNTDRALGEMVARHTADTHLHLIEAYSELQRATNRPHVADALAALTETFVTSFLAPDGLFTHQKLDDQGDPVGATIWPGHDIEASWLLDDVACLTSDDRLRARLREKARGLTNGAVHYGMQESGAWLERVTDAGVYTDARILWWVQAEAVLGLVVGGLRWEDENLVERALKTWKFINEFMIDPNTGDWRLRVVNASGLPDPVAPRVVFWKDPYHQARACMQISKRVRTFLETREL